MSHGSESRRRFARAMGVIFADGAAVAREALAAGMDPRLLIAAWAAEPGRAALPRCALTFETAAGPVVTFRLGASAVEPPEAWHLSGLTLDQGRMDTHTQARHPA